MRTKIQKWGHSLGLRIPRALAAEAQVEEGSMVDLTVAEGCLHIRRLAPSRYVLEELLKGIRPDNVHAEAFSDNPIGRETW